MTDGAQGSRRWVEHTVGSDEAGRTVQEVLTASMGVSRRMIQRLTRAKGVLLNRRPAFLGRRVREGDVVAARLAWEEEPGLQPVPMELSVVHEDADLLVVDKPAGLLVHPLTAEHTRTLAHGIAHHFAATGVHAKVRPVHRLDRDTSGLLVVAKTPYAHQHLDRQLRGRTLTREYLALARGALADDAGVVDAPIGAHPRHPHLRAVRADGDPARTRFRVVERLGGATLVRLELETGRTHQARVHLAHLGHPLLGDRQYGGNAARADPIDRQALHAWRVSLAQPTTGDNVALEAPLPEDMDQARNALRVTSGE